MKYTRPTKKMVSEMFEAIKPLGFVGTGETSMEFVHTGLRRRFDFSACSKGSIPAIIYRKGFEQGIEQAQAEMRMALGME